MKMYRLTCLTTLALITLIGLISIPFMPTIAAALKLPVAHQPGLSALSSPVQASVPDRPTGMPTSTMAHGKATVLAADNFQRADRVFWGTTSNGRIWGGDANTNPGFIIAHQNGRIMQGHGVYNAVLEVRATNAEAVFSGALSSFQHNNIGAILRWNDANNWYKAYINGMQLVLARDVGGVITTLDTVPFPASATMTYTLCFRVQGTQLLARTWPLGQAEPRIWMVKAVDSALTAGFVGLRLVVLNGDEAIISSFAAVAVAAP
jgi:hypothetical protein